MPHPKQIRALVLGPIIRASRGLSLGPGPISGPGGLPPSAAPMFTPVQWAGASGGLSRHTVPPQSHSGACSDLSLLLCPLAPTLGPRLGALQRAGAEGWEPRAQGTDSRTLQDCRAQPRLWRSREEVISCAAFLPHCLV